MNSYQPCRLELLDNVPRELAEQPVWLHWRARANGTEKPKKVPFYVDGKVRAGKLDTAQDRARLVTLDQARDCFDVAELAGLGVALGRIPDTGLWLSGIDLDGSVNGAEVGQGAMQVVRAGHGAYAEISPSGTGLKLFGTGDIGTEKSDKLEIYSGARFFTVTGERIEGDRLADLTEAATLARVLLAAPSPSTIVEGGRNNRCISYAGTLRSQGLPQAEAWHKLREFNRQHCRPPLPERELQQVLHSAYGYAQGFALTDLGNAERLVAHYGDSLRYLKGAGWHRYRDHRWCARNADAEVHQLTASTLRTMYAEAAAEQDDTKRRALAQHARASESRSRIDAAVAMAAWQQGVVDHLEEYDTNPYLIGLANGVYNLERMEFRAGQRDDRITLAMNVAYDPNATCPRWEQFQQEIHAGDAATVAFKQRAWGYTLSGITSEQKLFVCYGEGANGKTTEQNVVLQLHGEYAKKIEPETLLVRSRGGANNDVARLRGARFVATVEVEDGGRLAESLVKQLTGGDRMAARFLFKEFFEFRPTAKIWIATNHRPEITGTDYAIWRRILLVPYSVQFAEERRDPTLEEKLLAELPGIFNWMVAGYRQWREHGLELPEAVVGATEEYREDMDRVGNFLREACSLGGKGRTNAGEVYRAYRDWMEENGLRPVSAKKFHERMERDHKLYRARGGNERATYPGLQIGCADSDQAADVAGSKRRFQL